MCYPRSYVSKDFLPECDKSFVRPIGLLVLATYPGNHVHTTAYTHDRTRTTAHAHAHTQLETNVNAER